MRKYVNYFFAAYFLIYGMLMAFRVLPIDYFTVGCLSLLTCIGFLASNKY